MKLRTIEKLIETSRHYFNLPMPELAKPESLPRYAKPAHADRRSAKAARHEERQIANDWSLRW